MVEQRTENPRVPSSILGWTTMKNQVTPRLGTSRLETNRLAACIHRLGVLAELVVGGPQVGPHEGDVRPETGRFPVSVHRAGVLAQFPVRVPDVVPRGGSSNP